MVTSQPQLVVNAAGQTLDRLTVPPPHWRSRADHAVDHHPQKRQKEPPADVFQPAAAAPVPPKEQRDNSQGSLTASVYTTRELVSWLAGLARAQYLLGRRLAVGRICLRLSLSPLSSPGRGGKWPKDTWCSELVGKPFQEVKETLLQQDRNILKQIDPSDLQILIFK